MSLNFKTGKEAVEAFENAPSGGGGRVYRHWMKAGESNKGIFLDGDLNAEGELIAPVLWEHSVKRGDDIDQYVCLKEDGDCPLCASEKQSSYMCGYLTIVVFKPNGVYRNLFAFKKHTFQQLIQYAKSLGGLSGQMFNITRTSATTANVGDVFVPIKKAPIADWKSELVKAGIVKPEYVDETFTPLVLDEVLKVPAGGGGLIGQGTTPGPTQGTKTDSGLASLL